MHIIKRDGKKELVKYDKITTRIRKQTYGLNLDYVEPLEVAKKVIQGVHDGVTSVQVDNLAAETAAGMTTTHPDYSILASRIAITSLHKSTKKSFVETMEDLYTYTDPKTGNFAGMIADEVIEFIRANVTELEHAVSYDRDFYFDYFGFKTLEKSYLLRMNEQVAERPQHLWMRVACGIWAGNLEEVIKTYDLLSQGYFTHATPTLFNAGTRRPQLSSCFLIDLKEDSIEGIFDTLKSAALISKNAGGIGIHLHKLRSKGAYIKGTNGSSNGIVPFLRIFNETARAVDQCFTRDTLIVSDKGDISIEELSENDKVLTHDNSFKQILKKKKFSYTGPLVKISVGEKEIRVTPDHLFLVLRKDGELEWVEAKNLLLTDKIVR